MRFSTNQKQANHVKKQVYLIEVIKLINQVLFNIKLKTSGIFRRLLNSLEVIWRNETIKTLESKPETDELSFRLQYEKKMLSLAMENKYSNNIKDILGKMRDNKWF